MYKCTVIFLFITQMYTLREESRRTCSYSFRGLNFKKVWLYKLCNTLTNDLTFWFFIHIPQDSSEARQGKWSALYILLTVLKTQQWSKANFSFHFYNQLYELHCGELNRGSPVGEFCKFVCEFVCLVSFCCLLQRGLQDPQLQKAGLILLLQNKNRSMKKLLLVQRREAKSWCIWLILMLLPLMYLNCCHSRSMSCILRTLDVLTLNRWVR